MSTRIDESAVVEAHTPAPNAEYLRLIALRAASSGYTQIGLFWRGLPVL
jgi:hypothetical protein